MKTLDEDKKENESTHKEIQETMVDQMIEKMIDMDVEVTEEQLKDAVRNNEYEEIQSIVGFNYYQPLLLNNRHFLQASGEEIKHKPSAGVRYVLEDYDSLLIRDIAKGNLDTMFDNELLSFQGNPATEHELENIVKTKTTAY